MPALEFKLDVFTGPLDLLLHLISKHKLNINDIEITKLLEQYLLYIEEAKRQERAGANRTAHKPKPRPNAARPNRKETEGKKSSSS